MAEYEIQAPDGRIVTLQGDTPPTDADLDEIFANLPTSAPLTVNPEAQVEISQRNADYETKYNDVGTLDKLKQGLSQFTGQDVLDVAGQSLQGAERVASGATLGGYDLVNRLMGGNYAERKENLQQQAESAGIGGLNKLTGLGLEIGGNVAGAGKVIVGGLASRGLGKGIAPAAGAIEGAAYGLTGSESLGDVIPNVAIGAGLGGATGKLGDVAFGGLNSGIRKLTGKAATADEKALNALRNELGGDAFNEMIDASTQSGRSLIEVANPAGLGAASKQIAKSQEARNILGTQARNLSEEAYARSVNKVDEILGKKDKFTNLDEINEGYRKQAAPLYEQAFNRTVDIDIPKNSLGQPVAKSQKGAKNFDNWFKGSKVVNESGEPLVMYHGTDADFDVFDAGKIGSNSDFGLYGKGFYFTPNKNTPYGNKKMETYLSLKNPFEWNKYNKSELSEILDIDESWLVETPYGTSLSARASEMFDISDRLKNKGFDGVINEMNPNWKEYIAFSPNQIKSTQNTGGFSKSTDNILDVDYKDTGDIAQDSLIQDALNNVGIRQGVEPNTPANSFKRYDGAKKYLDDEISAAQRAGRNQEVRILQQSKDKLVNFLDEISPEYKEARKLYSDAYSLEKAQDLGFDLFSSRTTANQFKQDIAGLSQAEKESMEVGIREKLIDTIGSARGDTAVKLKDLVPEKVQDKLKMALGDDKTKGLISFAEEEIKRMQNLNQVLGQSRTAELQRMQKEGISGVKRAWDYTRDTLQGGLSAPFRAAEDLTGYIGSRVGSDLSPNIADLLTRQASQLPTPRATSPVLTNEQLLGLQTLINNGLQNE